MKDFKMPYGINAYRSNDLPKLVASKSSRNRVLSSLLNWGGYAILEPYSNVDEHLRQSDVFLEDAGRNECMYINNERWIFDSSKVFLILAPFLKGSSSVFLPWIFLVLSVSYSMDTFFSDLIVKREIGMIQLFAVFISVFSIGMMGLSMYFWAQEKRAHMSYFFQIFLGVVSTLLMAVFIPDGPNEGHRFLAFLFSGLMALSALMGYIGWDFLLVIYLKIFPHDGSAFNRQTGMLSYKPRFGRLFSAPFYEYDAVMLANVSRYGSTTYALCMYHRYSKHKVFLGGRLQSMSMSRLDCLAFWDMLQRYMDVSQPLPDIPILEQFRSQDPTTAEHDLQSGRNPRYWRDMPYATWKNELMPEREKRIREYPWQSQPCIIQAAIASNQPDTRTFQA